MSFDDGMKWEPKPDRIVEIEPSKRKNRAADVFGMIMATVVFAVGISITLGIVAIIGLGIYKTLEWMIAL